MKKVALLIVSVAGALASGQALASASGSIYIPPSYSCLSVPFGYSGPVSITSDGTNYYFSAVGFGGTTVFEFSPPTSTYTVTRPSYNNPGLLKTGTYTGSIGFNSAVFFNASIKLDCGSLVYAGGSYVGFAP